MSEKKLVKNHEKMILGVSGGLGAYLGLETKIVRIIFVLSSLLAGFGLLPYIILAIVMPKAE